MKITVMNQTVYHDLIDKYENPIYDLDIDVRLKWDKEKKLWLRSLLSKTQSVADRVTTKFNYADNLNGTLYKSLIIPLLFG